MNKEKRSLLVSGASGILFVVLGIGALALVFQGLFSASTDSYDVDQIVNLAIESKQLDNESWQPSELQIEKESVSLVTGEHYIVVANKNNEYLHIKSSLVDDQIEIHSVEVTLSPNADASKN